MSVERRGVSHFEYIVGFVSILMGLAVAELLSGIGRVFRSHQTVKIYWVHLVWMLLLIGVCILNWWVIWSVREPGVRTVGEFMILLAPRFLYVVSAFVLSPPIVFGQAFDLRSYYFSQVRLSTFLIASALLLGGVYRWMLGIESPADPLNVVRVLGAVLLIALSFSKSSRTHEFAAAVLTLLLIGGFVALQH
jgi:hypothetical protein